MIELWCCLYIVQRLHVNDEIIVSLASDYVLLIVCLQENSIKSI